MMTLEQVRYLGTGVWGEALIWVRSTKSVEVYEFGWHVLQPTHIMQAQHDCWTEYFDQRHEDRVTRRGWNDPR